MKVVDTDNHGSDYPDEKFVSESLSLEDAKALADKLNIGCDKWSSRYHKVVEDDYVLQPSFEP